MPTAIPATPSPRPSTATPVPTLLSPTITASPTLTPLADPVLQMLSSIDPERALSDMRYLTGESPVCDEDGCHSISDRLTGSQGLRWAQQYIIQTLFVQGYSLQVFTWSRSGYDENNLMLSLPGASLPDEWIVVVAHLDGVRNEPGLSYPAADDNASGVADLLELARVLSGHTFDRTIRILFSSGEEQGELGVRAWLDSLTPSELGSIQAVLNVDMVGYDANQDAEMELWRGAQALSMELANKMNQIMGEYPIHLFPDVLTGCY